MLAALGAQRGETRLVGGVVRDTWLGQPTADVDLATVLTPPEVRRRIEAAGAKAVPTGIEHGTVTAVFDGGRFEVTTLRRDVATDGRRAVVAFTDDWHADAARRDFTMNAMSADALTGEVFDYHGGIADLVAGRVRFIGDPRARIAEDHLRILRFFRFHARFGRGAPDADGLAACIARANDLMALSRERVRGELLKLLCADGAVAAVRLMLPEVLGAVLPAADDVEALERLAAREAELGQACAPLRRLAALLPPDAALLGEVAGRLRLSNAEKKRLGASAARAGASEPVDALAYRHGAESARDLLLLGDAAPSPDTLVRLDGWTRPQLPVSGGDLVAAGMPPGPEVARRLGEIERAWIAAGFPATVEL